MFWIGVLVGMILSFLAYLGLLFLLEYGDPNRKSKKKDGGALMDLVDKVPNGDRAWFKWHVTLAISDDEPYRPRPYPFDGDV